LSFKNSSIREFVTAAIRNALQSADAEFARPTIAGRILRAPHNPMPLGPGTRLGPYEILSAIGAGGMGEKVRRWFT